jgi:hypothetical protein
MGMTNRDDGNEEEADFATFLKPHAQKKKVANFFMQKDGENRATTNNNTLGQDETIFSPEKSLHGGA